jgi:hypothetical protein
MTRNSSSVVQREAPPLPEKIEDWERSLKAERTLNDLVEDIHRILVNEDEQYRSYLRATWDQHAITGSLSFDNCKACEIIKKKAKEIGSIEVSEEKLAVINLSLNVVLRRYKSSRKQRRNTVRGRIVLDDDDESD